jgi:hypothetical protein
MSGRSRATLAVMTFMAVACATTPGPVTWLPTGAQTQTSAFGAWVEVRRVGGDTMGGELLAATRDTLWIFHGPRPVAVSRQAVESGRLIGWDAGATEILQWTLLGTVSTLSNGLFAVFTAPIWMITGGIAGQNQAAKPVVQIRRDDWSGLAPWARFPQGFPAGLALDSLRPKPPAGKAAPPR